MSCLWDSCQEFDNFIRRFWQLPMQAVNVSKMIFPSQCYSDVAWASWRLKSPTTRLFVHHREHWNSTLPGRCEGIYWWSLDFPRKDLAPVPLSIFRSNSKFDENSERSSFEYTWPITTIFCTRHDSDTVVTCAKYRCDRPRKFYTRVFWIFIEFRIRSKYA